MATAVNTANYQNFVGSKHPTPQALISTARKALVYVVELTFDADYPAGGYVDASLKRHGAKTIDYVFWSSSLVGLEYDKPTDAIKIYTIGGIELSTGNAIPNGKSAIALVFART